MQLLKSQKLSQLIKHIDSSKFSKRILRRHMSNNEHFRDFVD
jgi:hypothetical protein